MECGLDGLLQTGRHGKSVQMAEMVFENSLLIPVLNQLIPSWGWLSSICFLMTRSREPAQLVEDLGSSVRTGKTQKKTLDINLSQMHLVTHSRTHKIWRFIWAGCLWVFSKHYFVFKIDKRAWVPLRHISREICGHSDKQVGSAARDLRQPDSRSNTVEPHVLPRG